MLAILAGGAAAIAFGVSTLCSARSSRSIGAASTVGWVALIGLAITPRIVGTAAVALPLIATRRFRVTRRVVPLLLTAASCEVAGFALYTLGARENIAVTAVLVSLFGAVAAILARLLFEERLARVQMA